MKFGYFTLSDNHYDDNVRSADTFVADIIDEAVYAEEVGLHSAWIGEHHFSTLARFPAPIWCSPTWQHGRAAFATPRPLPCCRCITRSVSPSNGPHSI